MRKMKIKKITRDFFMLAMGHKREILPQNDQK